MRRTKAVAKTSPHNAQNDALARCDDEDTSASGSAIMHVDAVAAEAGETRSSSEWNAQTGAGRTHQGTSDRTGTKGQSYTWRLSDITHQPSREPGHAATWRPYLCNGRYGAEGVGHPLSETHQTTGKVG